MSEDRTIGWQKYEDVLENQLSSPLVRIMLDQVIQSVDDKEEHDYPPPTDEETRESTHIIGISEEMAQDAAIASNFDCWVGHTNFDITPVIFGTLNKIRGVELLKICSRYRFFIGIGKMFKFRNVRRDLENQIL